MTECMCAGGYTCVCSVFVADLNSTQPISFHLFSDNSSVLTDTNLSYDYNLLPQPTPTPSISLLIFISIGVVLIIVILLIMFFVILLFSIFIVRRKRSVHSKNHTIGNIPLMQSISTSPVQTGHDMLYQDPSLYEDLNKAVRSLTKELDQKDIEVSSVIGNGEFGDVCRGNS